MAYHKVIGIDLGTTYSAVSVWDMAKNEVIVIPSALGSNTVPSVVGLDHEKKVIVGAPAQNNLTMDPENTIIEAKRQMGTYEEGHKPNPATDDKGVPKRIPFRGQTYLPQEISAFILMELKRQAENYIGEPIHDAVITVPAYFEEPQKGATQDAAAIARLNCKMLLNEPTAAAVCFGVDKLPDDGRKHIYAVYDLGGGTFDVSVIEISKGVVNVVGTGGNPLLGGGDFDDRITGHALQQIQSKHGVDLSKDPAIWARIKREAEVRKRELSATTAATLNLPYLTAQISENIPITRALFESLITDLLQASLTCLDQAIESAFEAKGVERDEIEQVFLVGGSTRIPRIRTMLAEHLGMEEKDIRCDFNPDEVVTSGAALVARDYNPSESYEGKELTIDMSGASENGGAAASPVAGLELLDVTSHTLGILANQSDMVPIIPKDSNIPIEVTQGGFINGGPSKVLEVLIFQGQHPVAFENTLIGKVPIELPEAREEGYYRFEVTFGLDKDGLLKVKVREIKTDKIYPAELQCNVRSSKAQIDNSAQHLADVMAASPVAAQGAVPPLGNIPMPPMPKPPMQAEPLVPAPQATQSMPLVPTVPALLPEPVLAPTVLAIPEPSDEVPVEFKSIARRSFKLLNTLSRSPEQDALLSVYMAFINAVNSRSPDVEDLGDELGDAYMKYSQK